uniref:C-type lectin domain-containing protein n=1 Tax=Steinernema glaseri TaxID=37863 RepID=A0A1I7Z776_9BILA
MSFCEALAILLLSLVSPSFSRDSRRILEVERFPEGVAVAGESEQFQLLHYDLVGCGYYFLNRTDIAFFSYDETQRSCVGYKHVTELVRGYGGLQTFYINRKDTPWRDQIECLKGWTRFEDRCYQMLLIELDDEKTPEEVTDMVFHDCSRRSGVASAQAVSIHKGPSGGEPHDVVISMTCDFHRNPKSLHKIFSKKPMAEEETAQSCGILLSSGSPDHRAARERPELDGIGFPTCTCPVGMCNLSNDRFLKRPCGFWFRSRRQFRQDHLKVTLWFLVKGVPTKQRLLKAQNVALPSVNIS